MLRRYADLTGLEASMHDRRTCRETVDAAFDARRNTTAALTQPVAGPLTHDPAVSDPAFSRAHDRTAGRNTVAQARINQRDLALITGTRLAGHTVRELARDDRQAAVLRQRRSRAERRLRQVWLATTGT